MVSPSRFLLFSFFCSMILIAATLVAEEAPPLPPVKTNNSVLKGLGVLMTGTGKMSQKNTSPEPVPSTPSTRQELRILEKLPPPKPIRQASFTTIPLTKLSDEPEDDERSADAGLPPESLDEELLSESSELTDIPNETLDRPLVSRKSANTDDAAEEEEKKIGGWKNKLAKPEFTPIISVGGSLLIVIAAFFLLTIVLRKISPKGNRPLPQEAFECLGRYYLTQKHQVQLLRVGSRIILVSVMPEGVKTLSEIIDPDETVALLGLCRRLDTNSATEMFRKTVANMSEDELSRPHNRPVITPGRKGQSAASLDLYCDPDESLAAILARGKHYGR